MADQIQVATASVNGAVGGASISNAGNAWGASPYGNDLDPDIDNDLDGLTDEEERLFTAVSFGKLHRVVSLLGNIRGTEVRNEKCMTILLHTVSHVRSRENLAFLVRLLVQTGSDVNAQDKDGLTPLMHVLMAGDATDVVRTLLRNRKWDPEVKDKEGNTALMHAARAGSPEAIALLLFFPSARRHSDVHATNNAGWTALDFAVKGKHVVCCQLLVDEGHADKDNQCQGRRHV